MQRQIERRNAKKFFVFMIVLGTLGLLTSWFMLGPQYLLLIPGLSVITVGEVIDVQHVPAMDGPYEYEYAIVQFTDRNGQLHTIKQSGMVSKKVKVRYFVLTPDLAVAEVNWLDDLYLVIQLLCMDLPSLALIVLGASLYRKHVRKI